MGNIKPDRLYRSASPCNNDANRAPYVSALMQQDKIDYVFDLSSTQEKLDELFAMDTYTHDPINGYTYKVVYPDGDSLDAMPAFDVWLYAQYVPNNHTLTINYLDENGQVLEEAYVDEQAFYTKDYSVASPSIDGYAPDYVTDSNGELVDLPASLITGAMSNEDVTYNVIYRSTAGKLVVTFTTYDGTVVATTYTETIAEGEPYEVTLPELPGYTQIHQLLAAQCHLVVV